MADSDTNSVSNDKEFNSTVSAAIPPRVNETGDGSVSPTSPNPIVHVVASVASTPTMAKSEDTMSMTNTSSSELSDCTSMKTTVNRKAGYALIKQEFLVPDYKPTLHTEYLSSEVKDKIAPGVNDNSEKQDASDDESEPPHKKAKLKGRNKQRPRNERIQDKDRMCPAIKDNNECRFGDRCKFSHDKQGYVDKKLPELEGTCYNFDTFGLCPYGISCRFAKNHITEDLQNIKNEELFNKTKHLKSLNELPFEVRNKLWKRKYDFRRADRIVKDVQRNVKDESFISADTNSKNPVANMTVENSKQVADLAENSNIVADLAENSNPVTDSVDSSRNHNAMNVRPESESLTAQTDNIAHSEKVSAKSNPDSSVSLSEAEAVMKTAVNITLPASNEVSGPRTFGCITDEEVIKLRPGEIKKIDFKNKLYLAPLTTVGNLPFRRICKTFGADITCGEMALVTQLLKAKQSEWSLIKRHPSEDIFGVQVCGSYPDTMTRCAQLLTETCSVDFIDINCGCPIDLIYKKGGGSALMGKVSKLEQICQSMTGVMGNVPLTVKIRTGVFDNKNVAHSILPRLRDAGVSLVTVHGRSREQRYTRLADWDYISQCAIAASPMPMFGSGDILSYEDANLHMSSHGVSGVMLARGALIKPWLFTEIKEQRHWDISANERLDILRTYTNYGLEHWGSDHQGVENTRRFLLEWLSFLHRYIPVGVLEQVPQRINECPPYYVGRSDLETLMASASCADWVKISEMLLGPVPSSFQFLPKHKANAYQ